MDEVSAARDVFNFSESVTGVFKIFPDEARYSRLAGWIELCGGVVLDPEKDDPCAIPVVDVRWYIEDKRVLPPKKIPPDHFDSSFIYKSFMKGKCVDLNDYRIKKSMYEDFDANRILRREISWNDLQRIPETKKPSRVQNNQKEGDKSLEPGKMSCGSFQKLNSLSDEAKVAATAREEPLERKRPASPSGSEISFHPNNFPTPMKLHARGNSSNKQKVAETGTRTIPEMTHADKVRKLLTAASQATPRGKPVAGPTEIGRSGGSRGTGRSTNENLRQSKLTTMVLDESRSEYFRTPKKHGNTPSKRNQATRASEGSNKSSVYSVQESNGLRGSTTSSNWDRRYTRTEDLKILDYICKNDLHAQWRGKEIWDILEEKRIPELISRTGQSMKERFRKKIYPGLGTYYACSAADLRKFKEGEMVVEQGRRRPARALKLFRLRQVPVISDQ